MKSAVRYVFIKIEDAKSVVPSFQWDSCAILNTKKLARVSRCSLLLLPSQLLLLSLQYNINNTQQQIFIIIIRVILINSLIIRLNAKKVIAVDKKKEFSECMCPKTTNHLLHQNHLHRHCSCCRCCCYIFLHKKIWLDTVENAKGKLTMTKKIQHHHHRTADGDGWSFSDRL